MWSIIQAAGWPIWPLIFASVIALALILSACGRCGSRQWRRRAWSIASRRIRRRPFAELVSKTAAHGPLGRVLAAGLANVKSSRPVMKEAIEEVGRVVNHDLERFFYHAGTIAAMSPLLGLFGTVVGMIEISVRRATPGPIRSSWRTASGGASTTPRSD